MAGQDVTFDRVPYFFTDQYDVGMEYSGTTDGYDRVVFRGDPAGGSSSRSGSPAARCWPA